MGCPWLHRMGRKDELYQTLLNFAALVVPTISEHTLGNKEGLGCSFMLQIIRTTWQADWHVEQPLLGGRRYHWLQWVPENTEKTDVKEHLEVWDWETRKWIFWMDHQQNCTFLGVIKYLETACPFIILKASMALWLECWTKNRDTQVQIPCLPWWQVAFPPGVH